MAEPRLTEIPGPSRIGVKFFNKIIRRIECTKPIPGTGVTITENEDGIVINATATSGGSPQNLNQITLNVCSNGTPSTIIVYGPATS
jgi:hypothetical protein